jgi:hypothetical protein
MSDIVNEALHPATGQEASTSNHIEHSSAELPRPWQRPPPPPRYHSAAASYLPILCDLAILSVIFILILVTIELVRNTHKIGPLPGANVTVTVLPGAEHQVNGIAEARKMGGLALITLALLRLAMGVL